MGFYRRQMTTIATTRIRGWGAITTPKATRDPLMLPVFYWPNYGYEPYWADGEWMLKALAQNRTTEKIPLVCGEECGFMDMRIKEVCAQKSGSWNFGSCVYGECTGETLKDITNHYQTFNTYCEFLDTQCRAENDST